MFTVKKFKKPDNFNVTIKTFKNGNPYEGDLSKDDPILFATYPSISRVMQVYNTTVLLSNKNKKCYIIEVHEIEIIVVEVIC